MRTAMERRKRLIELLSIRRSESAENFAVEFGVSVRTIYRDIEILALSYPIYTTKGTGGGIHIMDNFRLVAKYLTDEQYEVLERLSKETEKKDAEILQSIMKTFKQPTRKII